MTSPPGHLSSLGPRVCKGRSPAACGHCPLGMSEKPIRLPRSQRAGEGGPLAPARAQDEHPQGSPPARHRGTAPLARVGLRSSRPAGALEAPSSRPVTSCVSLGMARPWQLLPPSSARTCRPSGCDRSARWGHDSRLLSQTEARRATTAELGGAGSASGEGHLRACGTRSACALGQIPLALEQVAAHGRGSRSPCCTATRARPTGTGLQGHCVKTTRPQGFSQTPR